MGHDILDWVIQVEDEKFLIYHNITPHHFFPAGSPNHYYSQLGRKQLDLLKNVIKASICDSHINEEELIGLGYKDTTVIPLLINIDDILKKNWNQEIEVKNSYYFNVLFVGRISPNKCQHDLVIVANYLRSLFPIPFKIHLVGGYEHNDPYYQELKKSVDRYGLSEIVHLTGKVSEEDLYGYYRLADLFVSMSEHEGFGVPLIEAMVFDVPVIAYNSSNIPYTLGNSGLLLNTKNHLEIASLIEYIAQNKNIRRRIIERQRQHLRSYSLSSIIQKLITFFKNNHIHIPCYPDEFIQNMNSDSIQYQIEGPFDSSYSLAMVNREIARALNGTYPDKVTLHSTDGLGDYNPSNNPLPKDIQKMWDLGKANQDVHAVIRNLYPPRVSNMKGTINILGSYGWEESGFPGEYIDGFYAHLDGIATMSDYVTQLLISNGVSLPIITMGIGVDHCLTVKEKQYYKNLGKGFRFLHISSGFPRKGIDVLLKAYTMAFTNLDDVTLIIKTVPHYLNTVSNQVHHYRKNMKSCPNIILIDEDLDYGYIINLYKRCNAYVGPSRGEGFGLPFAEAMLFGLPVIITGYGGQLDFADKDNAWLIDYSFAYAETHIGLNDSVWVEPDAEHLATLMKEIASQSPDLIQKKTKRAKETIQEQYTWNQCARRLDQFVHALDSSESKPGDRIRLGWVSGWGTKKQVAKYSGSLLHSFDPALFHVTVFSNTPPVQPSDDQHQAIHYWNNIPNSSLDSLYSEVVSKNIDILLIHFEFGFFDIGIFGKFIDSLSEKDVAIIIIMHSTVDYNDPGNNVSLRSIGESLRKVQRIFVHCVNDLNQLKEYGIICNTALFPHGVDECPSVDIKNLKRDMDLQEKKIIASYGHILPYKGITELLYAFKIVHNQIPESHLLLISTTVSSQESLSLLEECRSLIQDLNLEAHITLITNYLEDRDSLALLSLSDVIVYPYQYAHKASSNAVRLGLASGKPVLCTPLITFNDVAPIIYYLSGTDHESIALGIISSLQKTHIHSDAQLKWIEQHQWSSLSKRLMNIIASIQKHSTMAFSHKVPLFENVK
nr:glycosyltransferase [Methanocalculus alkaliphilus]